MQEAKSRKRCTHQGRLPAQGILRPGRQRPLCEYRKHAINRLQGPRMLTLLCILPCRIALKITPPLERQSKPTFSTTGTAHTPSDASAERSRRDISEATVLWCVPPLVWRKSAPNFVQGSTQSCVIYGRRSYKAFAALLQRSNGTQRYHSGVSSNRQGRRIQ